MSMTDEQRQRILADAVVLYRALEDFRVAQEALEASAEASMARAAGEAVKEATTTAFAFLDTVAEEDIPTLDEQLAIANEAIDQLGPEYAEAAKRLREGMAQAKQAVVENMMKSSPLLH